MRYQSRMDGGESLFGWLVFKQAVAGTRKFFGSKTRDVVLAFLALVVGFGVYWYFRGLPVAIDQLLSILMFTTVPFTLFVMSVFIWNLWLAPAALLYESRDHHTPSGAGKVDWHPWIDMESYTARQMALILAKDDPASARMSSRAVGYFQGIKRQC